MQTRKSDGAIEKIQVSRSISSKPPQHLKMKFEANLVMKSLCEAFLHNFEDERPKKEKSKVDLDDKKQRRQNVAVVKKEKAMMQLASSFITRCH